MKVIPIQFIGNCIGCGATSEKARGAIEMEIAKDGHYDWLCLKCAEQLSLKLAGAVALCRHHMKNGDVYRSDKWQKPKTE